MIIHFKWSENGKMVRKVRRDYSWMTQYIYIITKDIINKSYWLRVVW